MKRFFKKAILWIYIHIHTMMINISIALRNTEEDILKANPFDLQERDKKTTRMLHRNPLLEKFYAGNRDEKTIQHFYELLKKTDKFLKTATPHKMAVAADKHGSNYGLEDIYGKKYEHYGFFDAKHKHAGKTLEEVLDQEFKDRRTTDDDLELLYIFNNEPIEVGLIKIFDVLEEPTDENADYEYVVADIEKKSKQFNFPIKVQRDNENVVNKIEQLTEFMHVKMIGFEHRQLEFFIPLKYKIDEVKENSDIFNELINIKTVFIRNEYGEFVGFGITNFIKRIKFNDTHEVWKFNGIELKDMGEF